jgi:hypothetical protein
MTNRKGRIMRSSFTKLYCPAVALAFAGLMNNKKPTIIQGTKSVWVPWLIQAPHHPWPSLV